MAQAKQQSEAEPKSATQTKRLLEQESALQSARRRFAQNETKKSDTQLDSNYDKPRVPPTVGGLHSQIKKLTETIKSQP